MNLNQSNFLRFLLLVSIYLATRQPQTTAERGVFGGDQFIDPFFNFLVTGEVYIRKCVLHQPGVGGPTEPSPKITLDFEGFPIQAVEVSDSLFSKHAVDHYHAKELLHVDGWLRMICFCINSSINCHNFCW